MTDKKCPACGAQAVVPIEYGYPAAYAVGRTEFLHETLYALAEVRELGKWYMGGAALCVHPGTPATAPRLAPPRPAGGQGLRNGCRCKARSAAGSRCSSAGEYDLARRRHFNWGMVGLIVVGASLLVELALSWCPLRAALGRWERYPAR